jgi:uncharacterized protein YbaP (TraB family)
MRPVRSKPKHFKWRSLAALAGLFAAACATPRPAAETAAAPEPKPALWALSDHDTKIYLFGTIHMLPRDLKWRTPALDKAIAESDELVLETVLGTDLAGTGRTMMRMGLSPGLPPLAERVPPEKRAALAAMIESSGFPAKTLDRMETWAAALSLTAASFRSIGINAEDGVEKSIEGAYRAPGKSISGLETVEQQFGFFDTLSEEAQRAFLLGAVDDPAAARAQFQAMLKAWAAGDVAGIAASFDGETALSPELREVLMKRRNAAWADWLQKRLARPGTILVAVGAGHLAGKDSVQTLLEARGLKAKRVQ